MNLLLSNTINFNRILIIVAIVACLAIVFALLIVLVSKLCFVEKDKVQEEVLENLGGANCGGCGFNGCSDFAKALCEGKTNIDMCNSTDNENKEKICKILNIPFSASEKKFAVVHCAGGLVSKDKYIYAGNDNCVSQSSFLGGKKVCNEGCLSGGTCEKNCPYHAIHVKEGVAVADKSLCEACGACVVKCPKHIIELIPKKSKIYVACSSKCKGKEVMETCKVGCIGCGLCAKNCPNSAITIVDNFPIIDYSKCSGCKLCVNKCPRKCIKEI